MDRVARQPRHERYWLAGLRWRRLAEEGGGGRVGGQGMQRWTRGWLGDDGLPGKVPARMRAVEEGSSRIAGGRGTAVQRRDGVLSWVHARVGNWRIQIRNEGKREKGIKKGTRIFGSQVPAHLI
jgi:hypothetical protein